MDDILPVDSGAILLVGEANFSFSASLMNHVSPDVNITASSFETEADVCGRLRGGENVKILKENGAEVLYGIDCTQLHKLPVVQHRRFDVIIFNFPHTGRKGSIKKNRQLLKDFFISCSTQLNPNGHVLVSLCNGQGGTPMDAPQREWYNSWQVVAMATYGGYILTAAIPFTSLIPEDYRNTGYRGQNKGFHAEGAITHVFEKSLPLQSTLPMVISPLAMVTDDNMVHGVEIPTDLRHFLNRKLLTLCDHPLSITADAILSALTGVMPCIQHLQKDDLIATVASRGHQCAEAKDAIPANSSLDGELPDTMYGLPDVKMLQKDDLTGILQVGSAKSCPADYVIEIARSEDHGPFINCGLLDGLPSDGILEDKLSDGLTDIKLQDPNKTSLKVKSPDGLPSQQIMNDKLSDGLSDIEPRDRTLTDRLMSGRTLDKSILPDQTLQKVKLPDEAPTSPVTNQLATNCHANDGTCHRPIGTDHVNDHTHTIPDGLNSGKSYKLIGSLLHYIPHILHTDPAHPVAMTSEVYQRCLIATDILPIMHQMLVILPQVGNNDALWDRFEHTVADAVSSIVCCGNNSQCSIDTKPGNISDMSAIFHASDNANGSISNSVLKIDGVVAMVLNNSKNHIGICGIVTCKERCAKFALLYLDHLAMNLLNVKDIRLLWSEDPRQWNGIREKMDEIFRPVSALPSSQHSVTLEPHSKHPPSYPHDLSFWVKMDSGADFEELKFSSVVCGVTGLLLEELTLLDTYVDETSGRCSRCYRLVYRSVDRALTREQATQIQLNVRDAVSNAMLLDLR